MKGECPACYFEIEVDLDIELHEVVMCEDCGATLEVVKLENGTVEFEIAEEIGEDWGE